MFRVFSFQGWGPDFSWQVSGRKSAPPQNLFLSLSLPLPFPLAISLALSFSQTLTKTSVPKFYGWLPLSSMSFGDRLRVNWGTTRAEDARGTLTQSYISPSLLVYEEELSANPEREFFYWQPTGPNPLNHRDDFSRPALRHGSLNSLFQIALYLPS